MTNNNSKDWLKRLDVYANVLGSIGTVLIAGIGICFTNSYNNSQQDLDRNKALTSVIEFIDENKPEAQLKTAYNILVKLGYQNDFIDLAVDYPNPIATEQLIELAKQELREKKLKKLIDDEKNPICPKYLIEFADKKKVEIPAYKAVRKIISNAEQSQTKVVSAEKKRKLLDSVDIIAQAKNYEGFGKIAQKAEEFIDNYQEKESLKPKEQTNQQNLWVVVIAAYDEEKSAQEGVVEAREYLSSENDPDPVKIYKRDNKYRVVSVYASQEDARKALEKAKEKRSSSYLRNLEEWCSRANCIEISRNNKNGSETKTKSKD